MDTVNNYLSSLAPDVTASLTSVIESTEGIIRKVHLISSVLPEGKSVALLDPEVKELMAKAMKEAGEEAERVAPKVPTTYDPEVLERKLIEYIRVSGGVISVRQAAQSLSVAPAWPRERSRRVCWRRKTRTTQPRQTSTGRPSRPLTR